MLGFKNQVIGNYDLLFPAFVDSLFKQK